MWSMHTCTDFSNMFYIEKILDMYCCSCISSYDMEYYRSNRIGAKSTECIVSKTLLELQRCLILSLVSLCVTGDRISKVL